MKSTLAFILIHLLPLVALAEFPAVDIPQSLRVVNWNGSDGEGSCTIAAVSTLLNWQGRYNAAARLQVKYESGQSFGSLSGILDSEGIRYAATFGKADVSFLDWAVSTRRGCAVSTSVRRTADHMILLVHFDEQYAGIIDVRNPSVTRYVARDVFLDEWKTSLSWAITPVYAPLPPTIGGQPR